MTARPSLALTGAAIIETLAEATRVNRNRPATNPGGCQCMDCDEIFIGEEWHVRCAVCEAKHVRNASEDTYEATR